MPWKSPQKRETQLLQERFYWFFVITLTIWTLVAMVLPIATFCLTKNSLYLSGFSTLAPPICLWYRFSNYLFPMDEKTFELEKLRIEKKTQKDKNSHQDKRETGN